VHLVVKHRYNAWGAEEGSAEPCHVNYMGSMEGEERQNLQSAGNFGNHAAREN